MRVTAEISNKVLTVQLHLPDLEQGFYRGTRFDWSGIIGKLVYSGHNYYGPWFTRVDPTVYDFTFQGADIVAGSCGPLPGRLKSSRPTAKDWVTTTHGRAGRSSKLAWECCASPRRAAATVPTTLPDRRSRDVERGDGARFG